MSVVVPKIPLLINTPTQKAEDDKDSNKKPQKIEAKIPDFCGSDRVIERKVVYYSDYEISVSEWKSECDSLELNSKNLQKGLGIICLQFLGETWTKQFESAVQVVTQSGSNKSSWGVIFEYVILTAILEKVLSVLTIYRDLRHD
jgi:hypothetical protein